MGILPLPPDLHFLHDKTVMRPLISVSNLNKTYEGGFTALRNVNLEIMEGEILALLGPNGAGKTTLISIICGIVNPSEGTVTVGGFDIVRDYRQSRRMIGLVPQELTTESFETVWNTVRFTRGLFGKAPDPAYIERLLKDLSLWDKKDSRIMQLSGGMKRRLLIAKALSHEPRILFLDEPTAGVDVSLRQGMWDILEKLRESGVTIILTTHYINEAEMVANRVGVINHGRIVVVDEKVELMRRMGTKQLILELHEPLDAIPEPLESYDLILAEQGHQLVYTYDIHRERTGITALLGALGQAGVRFRDLKTEQSSLEDIFVDLVREEP